MWKLSKIFVIIMNCRGRDKRIKIYRNEWKRKVMYQNIQTLTRAGFWRTCINVAYINLLLTLGKRRDLRSVIYVLTSRESKRRTTYMHSKQKERKTKDKNEHHWNWKYWAIDKINIYDSSKNHYNTVKCHWQNSIIILHTCENV